MQWFFSTRLNCMYKPMICLCPFVASNIRSNAYGMWQMFTPKVPLTQHFFMVQFSQHWKHDHIKIGTNGRTTWHVHLHGRYTEGSGWKELLILSCLFCLSPKCPYCESSPADDAYVGDRHEKHGVVSSNTVTFTLVFRHRRFWEVQKLYGCFRI